MAYEIQFFTSGLEIMNGVCEDVSIRYNESVLINMRLDVTVEFRTYKDIVKNGYFHLKYEEIPKGLSFDSNKPIRISLKPSGEFFQSLMMLPSGEAIQNILFHSDQKETFLHEINWYLLSVGQLVDLPDGQEGTLEEGFETSYGKEDQEEEMEMIDLDLHNYLDEFKDIEYILDKYDMPYHREEDQIHGAVYFDDERWSVFIYESNRVFLICSVYHFFIDESNYDQITRKLLEINNELTVGSFDFDFSEGIITFRTSMDVGDGYVEMDDVERMLIGNIATAKSQYGVLKAVSK